MVDKPDKHVRYRVPFTLLVMRPNRIAESGPDGTPLIRLIQEARVIRTPEDLSFLLEEILRGTIALEPTVFAAQLFEQLARMTGQLVEGDSSVIRMVRP